MFGQEFAHRHADFSCMGLQGEMAAIEEADVGRGYVAPERLGAGRDEERIVLAPYGQHRRLMLTQIGLEGVVERDIGLVVEQQVELDFVITRPRQIEIVQIAAVG